MNLLARAIDAFETAPLPDAVRRGAIAVLVARASRQLSSAPESATALFARAMERRPIAEHTDAANAQHYELPADFFAACLGPRRKYSCCLYENGAETLEAAEAEALARTCANADLQDGHSILELGCGWGSLSLWMAEHYPRSRIVAVSNSKGQREHIQCEAAMRGLANLSVVTADMNEFEAYRRFDRIVSVEMFEHMSNWRALLARCRTWLEPDGRVLVHVFAHRAAPYRFDCTDEADWIARHFFTGGVMPSRALIGNFTDLFEVESDWWWSGAHYQRTALHWLANFDSHAATIRPILAAAYGREARLWEHRWRLFFLATAGMFGHAGGADWGVAHYRLNPAR